MRKVFLLLLLLLFFNLTTSASSIENYENESNRWLRIGEEYYSSGKNEQAIKAYTNSIKLYEQIVKLNKTVEEKHYIKKNRDRHLALLYNFRGDAYRNMKKFSNAIKDYTKSIEHEPEYYNHYFYRAEMYFIQGKYELAIKDYDEAIRLRKDDKMFNFFFKRGKAQENLKQYDLAIKEYKKAMEAYPRFYDMDIQIA